MHEVDQDVVVMYTLVTIFLFKFFSKNLTFFTFIRFMRVLRVYVGYLLVRVYVGYLLVRVYVGYLLLRVYVGYLLLRVYVGYLLVFTLRVYVEGVLIDAFSRIVVQKRSLNSKIYVTLIRENMNISETRGLR